MDTRRFLITGGSQGIGAALVSLARAQGHEVVFTGRDQGRIDEVAAESGAHGLRADVTRADDNRRTVDAAVDRMGGIDVLVNNAGVGYLVEVGDVDMDRMRALFDINVFGLVDLTNRVVPLLKAQQAGYVFNIASTSGMKGGSDGHGVRREQVGGARHQPVLAGRAAPARRARCLRLPVRGADGLDGGGAGATTRTNCTRWTSPRRSWPRSPCTPAPSGPSWRSSPTTPGRKTEPGRHHLVARRARSRPGAPCLEGRPRRPPVTSTPGRRPGRRRRRGRRRPAGRRPRFTVTGSV